MQLRVGGYQMAVGEDIEQNTAAICSAIQRAASAGAQVLLTPEGSLSGYRHDFDPQAAAAGLEQVTALAKAEGVGLALGTCFQEADGKIYNQLRFYDRQGKYLGFHGKILRCGTMREPVEGEINHFAEAPLRVFSLEGLAVGGLICNDLWANPGCTPMPDPHLSQRLAGMGARVIFHAVNGGRDGSPWARQVVWPFHESNLRMRAQAGGVWIVTVDSSAPPDLPCSAPGGVIDPHGEWVCRTAPQGEDFFVTTMEVMNAAKPE